ncbi:MAG: DUF2637 domain-containing protein [Anaerolineales bacterium]|nr:DUF2637 domain-containing protein [Anaerolineales bacterium]
MNTKTIAWVTGSLTLLMALFSFILSFNALTDLAAKHSVSIPPLFPLVVEAGVIIFSLNALYRSIHGESAKWQWGLIIGSSLLAGLFNVLHAESDLISQSMSAMPSLFLLLSFETFLGQIKHAVKLSAVVKSITNLTIELEVKRQELDKMIADKQAELDALVSTKQGELNNLAQEVDTLSLKRGELTTQIETLKADIQNAALNFQQFSPKIDTLNDARQAKRQERLNILLRYLSSNPYASLREAAQELGTSRQTASNYVNELTKSGKLHQNGNGWEVTA